MTNAEVLEINLGVTLRKGWIWVETRYSAFISLTYERVGSQIVFTSEYRQYDKTCKTDK